MEASFMRQKSCCYFQSGGYDQELIYLILQLVSYDADVYKARHICLGLSLKGNTGNESDPSLQTKQISLMCTIYFFAESNKLQI